MQKSKIEWVRNPDGTQGYTLNPIKGLCPVDCKDSQGKSYCYARRMYKRFKWNPEIRFQAGEFLGLPSKPSRVFVGSTIELFGDWVSPEWLTLIFDAVKVRPQHTFIFLTKQPQNLIKWSPFPENCWVGVSATNQNELANRLEYMRGIQATVKFVSFEPLLDWADEAHRPIYAEGIVNSNIQWVIIGQCTPPSKKTSPKLEWIKEIVEACDKANIPVFLKQNLYDAFVFAEQSIMLPFWALNKSGEGGLRQEFPK